MFRLFFLFFRPRISSAHLPFPYIYQTFWHDNYNIIDTFCGCVLFGDEFLRRFPLLWTERGDPLFNNNIVTLECAIDNDADLMYLIFPLNPSPDTINLTSTRFWLSRMLFKCWLIRVCTIRTLCQTLALRSRHTTLCGLYIFRLETPVLRSSSNGDYGIYPNK